MLLEWYRRRDAKMERAPQGVPLHERLAHRAGADRRGWRTAVRLRRGRHGLPRHRSLKGPGLNNLKRELAPFDRGVEIDRRRGTRRPQAELAGRKLVDFDGPLDHRGRREHWAPRAARSAPIADIEASRRQALPLVGCGRISSSCAKRWTRSSVGAEDPELQPLIDAATRIAYAEDTAIFHGYAAGGIKGIDQASAHPILPIPETYQAYPQASRRRHGSCAWPGDGLTPSPWASLLHRAHSGGGRRRLPGTERRPQTWWTARFVWAPAVNGAVG